jgi:uncharacterized Rossmann fold enzyme
MKASKKAIKRIVRRLKVKRRKLKKAKSLAAVTKTVEQVLQNQGVDIEDKEV